jgi:curved DNA-binding protein CbpA
MHILLCYTGVRKIARHYHPDKHRGESQEKLLYEKLFSALADAYQVYKVRFEV